MQPPTEAFKRLAPDLFRAVNKSMVGWKGGDPKGIFYQACYDVIGPGWISAYISFLEDSWGDSCRLLGIPPHSALDPDRTILSTYLLVLAEACGLDLDKVLGE